ncbi:MAG: FG-GAP-like repeat-containing protein [Candidatus Acidiferrales bacterium]
MMLRMPSRHRLAWIASVIFAAAIPLAAAILTSHFPSLAQDSQGSPAAPSEAIRLNNLGVAYMDRQETEKGLSYFQKATAADPTLVVARVNEGIGLVNAQRLDEARKLLNEVVAKDPQNTRAWYNLGLIAKSEGKSDQGIEAFQHVVQIDPADPDAQYFLGVMYAQKQQYPQAIECFERAIALNPFHASAEFGDAQAYQRSGKTAESKAHLERFQHINATKIGKPMSLIYGEQGKYSLAEQIVSAAMTVPPAIAVQFVDATKTAGLPTASGVSANGNPPADAIGSGACVFDFDGDGLPDVFLANANGDGKPALLRNTSGGHFVDVTAASGLKIDAAGISCAAGDFDNDGKPDLAIGSATGVRLFHNQGAGKFTDVTEAAGIHSTAAVIGLTFVDYDHDGDLDLMVAHAEAPGELWRNNGNSTFTVWTDESGLAAAGNTVAALGSDINNDRAVDLVTTESGKDPVIYFNPREGRFPSAKPWGSAMPSAAVAVASLDFDKDNWMDLAFTHAAAPGLSLWRNHDGKTFDAVKLPKLNWAHGYGVAALDFDNDGWIDLVAVGVDAAGAGHVALLRNEGSAGFVDVTKAVGLAELTLSHPRAIVPFDYDRDGATDLLITQAGGPPILLHNVGGNKNNWIRLGLKGEADSKTAFGTKVEVYAGALRQKWEFTGPAGYLGQSDTEIIAGLGAAKEADVVRLLWPTGVLQDELSIAAGARPEIVELDRRGSSCPILFAWNGSKFEFISDIAGPGIVGHWIGPNQRNIPNSAEYLKVDGSQVSAQNGKLRFRLIEPMEELDYVDQVRLLAIDHPAGVEVYPNGHFYSNPPFPQFKVIATQGARLPAGAWDAQGHDLLPLLKDRDRKYVTDFPLQPYVGFAGLHSLELDLGPWDSAQPLRLILDGFTDYYSASSIYSAWQAGITPIPPYLEAQDASGKWVRVIDDMGFPAGLARTMVVDLTGKVPVGTRRIRIQTNLRVYWDRIRIDNSQADPPFHTNAVPLAAADLRFRGYPRVLEGNPVDDLKYIYEDVSLTGPYTRQAGNYTRYGDVRALLTGVDEKYVILGSGDEIAVEFDSSALGHPPAGWQRDYFFFADGFDKDMDFYAAYGDTVAPLPFHTLLPFPYPAGIGYPTDADHLNYFLEYNTRAVSGPAGNSFQFHYPSPQ